MTEHWTARFNGLPYAKGGSGPHAFNCWHFVAHVQREQFGRELPIAPDVNSLGDIVRAFRDRLGSSGWARVAGKPRSGDAVLMAHFRHPSHVGIFVDDVAGGSVLHCVEGVGSCLPSLFHLQAARWRITGYYRPAGEL